MQYSMFSYKQGKSVLHRCPSWIKILVLPVMSIAVFELPWFCTVALLVFQVIVAFCLRFTIREQLADLRAVLYYAVMLLIARLCMVFVQYVTEGGAVVDANMLTGTSGIMLLRLLCVMQSASIIFKTSTSLQLREGLGAIELAVRRVLHLRPVTPIADVVSLFVNFIPQVSKNWQQVKRAWKARGGKNSIRMYMVLLPVLFSVGMKQAYTTARAVSVRKKCNPSP